MQKKKNFFEKFVFFPGNFKITHPTIKISPDIKQSNNLDLQTEPLSAENLYSWKKIFRRKKKRFQRWLFRKEGFQLRYRKKKKTFGQFFTVKGNKKNEEDYKIFSEKMRSVIISSTAVNWKKKIWLPWLTKNFHKNEFMEIFMETLQQSKITDYSRSDYYEKKVDDWGKFFKFSPLIVMRSLRDFTEQTLWPTHFFLRKPIPSQNYGNAKSFFLTSTLGESSLHWQQREAFFNEFVNSTQKASSRDYQWKRNLKKYIFTTSNEDYHWNIPYFVDIYERGVNTFYSYLSASQEKTLVKERFSFYPRRRRQLHLIQSDAKRFIQISKALYDFKIIKEFRREVNKVKLFFTAMKEFSLNVNDGEANVYNAVLSEAEPIPRAFSSINELEDFYSTDSVDATTVKSWNKYRSSILLDSGVLDTGSNSRSTLNLKIYNESMEPNSTKWWKLLEKRSQFALLNSSLRNIYTNFDQLLLKWHAKNRRSNINRKKRKSIVSWRQATYPTSKNIMFSSADRISFFFFLRKKTFYSPNQFSMDSSQRQWKNLRYTFNLYHHRIKLPLYFRPNSARINPFYLKNSFFNWFTSYLSLPIFWGTKQKIKKFIQKWSNVLLKQRRIWQSSIFFLKNRVIISDLRFRRLQTNFIWKRNLATLKKASNNTNLLMQKPHSFFFLSSAWSRANLKEYNLWAQKWAAKERRVRKAKMKALKAELNKKELIRVELPIYEPKLEYSTSLKKDAIPALEKIKFWYALTHKSHRSPVEPIILDLCKKATIFFSKPIFDNEKKKFTFWEHQIPYQDNSRYSMKEQFIFPLFSNSALGRSFPSKNQYSNYAVKKFGNFNNKTMVNSYSLSKVKKVYNTSFWGNALAGYFNKYSLFYTNWTQKVNRLLRGRPFGNFFCSKVEKPIFFSVQTHSNFSETSNFFFHRWFQNKKNQKAFFFKWWLWHLKDAQNKKKNFDKKNFSRLYHWIKQTLSLNNSISTNVYYGASQLFLQRERMLESYCNAEASAPWETYISFSEAIEAAFPKLDFKKLIKKKELNLDEFVSMEEDSFPSKRNLKKFSKSFTRSASKNTPSEKIKIFKLQKSRIDDEDFDVNNRHVVDYLHSQLLSRNMFKDEDDSDGTEKHEFSYRNENVTLKSEEEKKNGERGEFSSSEESDFEIADETKPSKTKKWSMFLNDWFPMPRYFKQLCQRWVPKHAGSDPGFRRTLTVRLAHLSENNIDNRVFRSYYLFNIQSYRRRRMCWNRLETREEFFRTFIIHEELKKFFIIINQQKNWQNKDEKTNFFKKKNFKFSMPKFYQEGFNTWFKSLNDWKWMQRSKRSNLLTWIWLRRGIKKAWREIEFNSLTGILQFVKQEGVRFAFKKTVFSRYRKGKARRRFTLFLKRWSFFFKKK
jgi:hypothetical protein